MCVTALSIAMYVSVVFQSGREKYNASAAMKHSVEASKLLVVPECSSHVCLYHYIPAQSKRMTNGDLFSAYMCELFMYRSVAGRNNLLRSTMRQMSRSCRLLQTLQLANTLTVYLHLVCHCQVTMHQASHRLITCSRPCTV